jgi:hypothetical protein
MRNVFGDTKRQSAYRYRQTDGFSADINDIHTEYCYAECGTFT